MEEQDQWLNKYYIVECFTFTVNGLLNIEGIANASEEPEWNDIFQQIL